MTPNVTGHLTALSVGGHNKKFSINRQFIKFCKHDSKVFDICKREELASIIGELIGVPVVKAWCLPMSHLTSPPSLGPEFVPNEFVVMPLLDGGSFQQYRDAAASIVKSRIDQIKDVFAYMHWIGDDDRGIADVMTEGDHFVLVDNGLTGPPLFQTPLRGSHPYPHMLTNNRGQIVKKCIHEKPSLVAFVVRDVGVSSDRLRDPSVISRIELVEEDVLREIVSDLGMDSRIASQLIERKNTLRSDFTLWIDELQSHMRK